MEKESLPKVGDLCECERSNFRGTVLHSWTGEVTKVTAKRAYLEYNWFALDDPNRTLLPRYLEYTTRVVKIVPKGT